ncbi:tetratricopeptide repeat protein [Saccharothrix algeriensis]|uniref:Tetratricopeptide repeat protein n=1 Tax=Saccharothrix algeriensis TaxID=173560 RepID=A0A8T8I6N7_9PSEU|nr:tetratricopeptide repeat protein [Saccharothrix algeriensis]
MAVRFRLLGGVEADVGGVPVALGHAKQRGVLAVLLVEAGAPVTADALLERVWGDRLPARGRHVLHSYVSRLRAVLAVTERVRLVRRPGGYQLTADEQDVDLHRFGHLVARARAADDERAAALFDEALGLWRGEPLPDLDTPWAEALRASLAAQRLAAELDRADLALRRGRHAELLPDLAERARRHPLDERVAAQLVLALYRSGRQADALEHYRRVRARLVEELGADPGPRLRDLHQRVLAADPDLAADGPGAASASAAAPVPRQLPAVPRSFTGRAAELAALTASLDEAPSGTVVISAIGGSGGIGKTWLALAWAHRHRDRFPDGQLFVDLRGFSPDGEPVAAETAVRGFLDTLGVEPDRVPGDPGARAALFRSLIAGRRVLIVLDNAATADQVVPLLPGDGSAAVLVTSRNRLTELITRHGAHPLRVDVLPDAEARQVLVDRLGARRVEAEPDAVRRLLACCGGLPLALGVVAARATVHPDFPLSALADELHDTATRLAALDDGNPATSLPEVLSWSVDALGERPARVLALLGLAPGPDTGLRAAADLAGLDVAATRSALRALEDLHLVQQRAPGRYGMHDLVKLFAADRAHRTLPEADRDAALRRLVGFLLRTAFAAERVLDPHREPIRLADFPDCHPLSPPDQDAALDWFATEHRTLLAVQQFAAGRGWHDPVWQLAWSLDTFLYRRGHLQDAVVVWRAGVAAAERQGDPRALLLAHRLLGDAAAFAGLPDEAMRHLVRALELAERTDDRTTQAHTHYTLTRAWEQRGEDRRALDHALRALRLYRDLGRPEWECAALSAAGWLYARVGDHDQARAHCRAALELGDRRPDPTLAAAVMDTLGYSAHRTGDHAEALEHYREALELYREHGNTYNQADTLDRLGLVHRALGRPDSAREVWRQALDLYRAQDRADEALRVRDQLDALDGEGRGTT